MGFHRRTISMEHILGWSGGFGDFYSFDVYMTRSDSYSFDDDLSRVLWEYYSESDEDTRWEFWMCVLDFSEFFKDLNKCLSILKHQDNLPIHREAINRYMDLLRNKWSNDFYKIKVINFLYGSTEDNH